MGSASQSQDRTLTTQGSGNHRVEAARRFAPGTGRPVAGATRLFQGQQPWVFEKRNNGVDELGADRPVDDPVIE